MSLINKYIATCLVLLLMATGGLWAQQTADKSESSAVKESTSAIEGNLKHSAVKESANAEEDNIKDSAIKESPYAVSMNEHLSILNGTSDKQPIDPSQKKAVNLQDLTTEEIQIMLDDENSTANKFFLMKMLEKRNAEEAAGVKQEETENGILLEKEEH